MLRQSEPVTVAATAVVDEADRVASWWRVLATTDGDVRRAARDALITHHAPLVTHVATRMIGRLPDQVEARGPGLLRHLRIDRRRREVPGGTRVQV
ncbi:hypothetical protein [Demequina litorisediminis]|nr:hypothetical protein [Demequina litorisediminis]